MRRNELVSRSVGTYHGVAHLIAGRRQVDSSEELPDARLGRACASRQQHMEVTHKVLHVGHE